MFSEGKDRNIGLKWIKPVIQKLYFNECVQKS